MSSSSRGAAAYGSLGSGGRAADAGAHSLEGGGAAAELKELAGSLGQSQERPSYSRMPVVVGLCISFASLILISTSRHSQVSEALSSSTQNMLESFGLGQQTLSSSSTTTSSTGPSSSTNNALGSNEIVGEYTDSTSVILTDVANTGLSWSFSRDGYAAVNLQNDFFVYAILGDYDTVIEPYVPMSLLVMNGDTSSYYKYSVCSVDNDEASMGRSCQYGTLSTDPMSKVVSEGITFECSPYDEIEIEITTYSSTDNSASDTTKGAALCMYIRREIRSLSTADLSSTMDAMHVMWVTDEVNGQELYGDNYHDAKYLLDFHHFNAAWQDADHIHEGNGFLPQHLKMTNIVELAMQSVDPSVSMPYWDFTIESASDTPVNESPIMSPDMFGSMTTPVNERYGFTYADDSCVTAGIPDGRWAYIKADMNDKFPDLKFGYGYMRSPWNMNPSPYVSRFTANMMIGVQLPTCSSHYSMLEETDFMDFLIDFENDPHATTHSLIGGTYGCDMMIPLMDAGYINNEDSLLAICSNWVFYMKEFYRANYLIPKIDCDTPTNPDEASCGYVCIDGNTADLQFNLANKLGVNVPTDMGDDGWTAWSDFICTGDGQKIYSGDHLESASPSDPSFWPIHSTLERLTHAKLMAGGFKNTNWATDPVNDYVCNKAECYEEDYLATDYYDECCTGHYQNDQMLDAITGQKDSGVGPTNDFIMKSTDPTSMEYSMPYIYDDFSWVSFLAPLRVCVLQPREVLKVLKALRRPVV